MLSLAAVLFVVVVLGDDYPRLDYEFQPLLTSFGLFSAMTALCALSFIALTYRHNLRWLAQALMWSGLLATGYYYWP